MSKSLSFHAPLQLPVAVGATSPNPGTAGVIIWSTSTASHLLWNGSQWVAFASGGGGGGGTYVPVSGTATVDFGSTPMDQASVTVSAPTVTASSFIALSISPAGTADHPADEVAVEEISFMYANVVPGVSFDIVATCTDKFGLSGTFAFSYVIFN